MQTTSCQYRALNLLMLFHCLHVCPLFQKLIVVLNLVRVLCNRLFKTPPESTYVISRVYFKPYETTTPPAFGPSLLSLTPHAHFVPFWHLKSRAGFSSLTVPLSNTCPQWADVTVIEPRHCVPSLYPLS